MRLTSAAAAALVTFAACTDSPVAPAPGSPLEAIAGAPARLLSSTGVEMIDLTPDLGPFDYAFAHGVNDRGEVVGTLSAGSSIRAFVWRDGGMKFLDVPGASSTFARGINERGDIVGHAEFPFPGGSRAVIWTNDVPTLLPGQGMGIGINEARTVVGSSVWYADGTVAPLPPLMTEAHSINNNGWIKGHVSGIGGDIVVWNGVESINIGPFSYPRGGKNINDDNAVVGIHFMTGFVWRDGVFTELPPLQEGGSSQGVGINRSGDVAGAHNLGAGVWWSDGSTTDLGFPPDAFGDTYAVDLNNTGLVIGFAARHAVLWMMTPSTSAQLAALQSDVAALGASARSLVGMLDAAARSLREGRNAAAASQLKAFIRQVEALVRRGAISSSEGESLLNTARSILARL